MGKIRARREFPAGTVLFFKRRLPGMAVVIFSTAETGGCSVIKIAFSTYQTAGIVLRR